MSLEPTPLSVIARVSTTVTRAVDLVMGDRADYPLLVGAACVEALKTLGMDSQLMYGPCAWIEIMADQTPVWAGCWGNQAGFWVSNAQGEVIDLNVSVAHRKRAERRPDGTFPPRALYSPPMLWSREVPRFYRYIPEGAAECELRDEEDRKKLDRVLEAVKRECLAAASSDAELIFPNEPILCPGRKLLDDARSTFKLFDRALGVHGIPAAPI